MGFLPLETLFLFGSTSSGQGGRVDWGGGGSFDRGDDGYDWVEDDLVWAD